MEQPLGAGVVRVSMPAHPSAMVLARLQVAGVGRILDLDVDEIGELRLAVEELCLDVLARTDGPDTELRLTLAWDESSIRATCDAPDARAADVERQEDLDELSGQILSALVEEHGTDDGSGPPLAWFRTKRPAP